MASNITVDTITKGSTTLNTDEIVDTSSNQICKAWVNFNGTGTVAIRGSYNVSSITDNGTGRYNVNFSNNLVNSNYSPTLIYDNNYNMQWISGYSTSTYRINIYSGSAYYDVNTVGSIVFGD